MTPTSNRHQVSIEADPTLPILRITRDFDATPAQLMRAHTDPELFARWVGPCRFIDLRGGTGYGKHVARSDSHRLIEKRHEHFVDPKVRVIRVPEGARAVEADDRSVVAQRAS